MQTSTYNKIRDILFASLDFSGNEKELANFIYGRYDSFVYFKKDDFGKVQQLPCSEKSIRSNIIFCIKLGLLKSDNDATLKDLSKDELVDVERFDLVLQQAINDYLRQNDLPVNKITEAIDYLVLSDTNSLYQYLAPSLSGNMFRTCLFLLSQCGESTGQNILKKFEKKLYVTDKKMDEHNKKLKTRGDDK